MKRYVLDVKEDDNGEAFIELNDEIVQHMDVQEGDVVEWIDNHDGSFTLQKKVEEPAVEKVWVMVETVQMFRHRYMVETPKNFPFWALDSVTMEEAKEFSQEHLGETIVTHRVMSKEEALAFCDEDNDYARTWSDEKKMDAFFTRDGEKVEIK